MPCTMLASVSGRGCALNARHHQQEVLRSLPAAAVRPASGFANAPHHLQRRAIEQPAHSACRLRAAAAANGSIATGETVADVMTASVICVHPETSVDEALELLVSNKVSGLPVVDADNVVVGVVSDFDLLPLEAIQLTPNEQSSMFPDVNTDWTAFNALSSALIKNAGKSVEDVMTADPIVVRPNTGLVDAAQVLLKSRVRRLPVVDGQGKLMGVISRSNIIKAALRHRQQQMQA